MDSRGKSGSAKSTTMITLFVFLGLLNGAWAVEYTVGESAGWVELSQGAPSYDSQFANITLVVGDTLMFPYQQGAHNVYVVTPQQLANCDGTNPIAVHNEADAVITLNRAGTWAFICEIPTHCSQGAMHLQVTVNGGSAPTPAPVSTPVPAPVPAPIRAPISTPIRAPGPSPIPAPVPAPVAAPTRTPAPAPVSAPVQAPAANPTPFGDAPEMQIRADGHSNGAHSALSVPFAALLSSAAAGIAILVL